MKAVFLDAIAFEGFDLSPLKAVVDELKVYPETTPEQVAERIAGCEIVLTNKVVLDEQTIHGAEALKLINVVATGVNNVDVDAAKAAGIAVCNAQAYGVTAVAQHVLGLMLALTTNLVAYNNAVKAGEWAKSSQFCMLDFPIRELSGRTLGLVGYGALGQEVARLATAFGMQVMVSARPGSEQVPEGRYPFEEVLTQADVLTLHCPLTEATRNLIDTAELARMKPSAFLVNAARGGIVNEAALAEALRQGVIAAAATDVLSVEPPSDTNPLLQDGIPNLLITPHCAWGSEEARVEIIRQASENLAAYQQGQAQRRIV